MPVIIALVVANSVVGWEDVDHNHELVWAQPMPGHELASLWYTCVSRPIFLLILLVWLWRLVVVTRLFQQIAGLDLRLAPTHPDRAGGIGFVEKLPIAFAPFVFGCSVVIAAHWGHDALYHGLVVDELTLPPACWSPAARCSGWRRWSMFAGPLMALKRRGLATIGALLANYGRLFERRWILRETVDDGGLLGAPEIGPVADTVALYEAVSRMRPLPLSRRAIVPLAIAAAVPLVPVFATQMPLKAALFKLLGPLAGL